MNTSQQQTSIKRMQELIQMIKNIIFQCSYCSYKANIKLTLFRTQFGVNQCLLSLSEQWFSKELLLSLYFQVSNNCLIQNKNQSQFQYSYRRKQYFTMDQLKVHYLPSLKRNSNFTLNLRVFEKTHSKQPRLVRYSKMDNNLPKIGTVRDTSTHRCIFDVRKKAEIRQERLSHLLGKENLQPLRKGGLEKDYFHRSSQNLLSINFKRSQLEHYSVL